MIITKIHRKNTNNSKKFVAVIAAIALVFLMVAAFVVGSTVEKRNAQAPAESSVADVAGEQQVAAMAMNW